MVVNVDKTKRKGLFVNMSKTVIIKKLKTIYYIMLEHSIMKRLEICISINNEIG